MSRFGAIAFGTHAKALQTRANSRRAYSRADGVTQPDALGPDEAAFIAERDSFYLASVGEDGWPYVQHRGGPRGFLKVLDPHTLAFADYRGNKQYVSAGNVTGDGRVALMLMDYPNRTRLKVLARARLVSREEDPALLARLDSSASVERAFVLTVEALDWNCPQHITPRYTLEELEELQRASARSRHSTQS